MERKRRGGRENRKVCDLEKEEKEGEEKKKEERRKGRRKDEGRRKVRELIFEG